MATYQLTAFNNATDSENKIHADDVARDYGFAGGLVPGVTVYAYMAHPVIEELGDEWLSRGVATAAFAKPVYDGEAVEVVAEDDGSGMLSVEVRCGGELRATGTAMFPANPGLPPVVAEFPPAKMPSTNDRIAADPEAMRSAADHGELGNLDYIFDAEKATHYLESIRETSAIYAERKIAHPGFLLAGANYMLAGNVALGPWIHVSSEVANYGLVHDGDPVSIRGKIASLFEKKGHEFVDLAIAIFANGERPVARISHRAIYRPIKSS